MKEELAKSIEKTLDLWVLSTDTRAVSAAGILNAEGIAVEALCEEIAQDILTNVWSSDREIYEEGYLAGQRMKAFMVRAALGVLHPSEA